MEQPLAVNAENSRAKVQNVGGDSLAKLQKNEPICDRLNAVFSPFLNPGCKFVRGGRRIGSRCDLFNFCSLKRPVSPRHYCSKEFLKQRAKAGAPEVGNGFESLANLRHSMASWVET